MFWIGIVLSLLAALASVGPLRAWMKARCPEISDSGLDCFRFAVFVIGVGITVITHQADVNGKNRLTSELKAMRATTERETYVAASAGVKQAIARKLQANYFPRAPIDASVTIEFDAGDRNRELVGHELLGLLESARIPWRSVIGTTMGGEVRLALVLSCDPSMQRVAENMLEALQPRLKTTDVVKNIKEHSFQLRKHEVRLQLNGHPRFLADGSIEFR